MIVADTSALISLSTADVLETVLAEFEVHTTTDVVDELEETAEYDEVHGSAAAAVVEQIDGLTVHGAQNASIRSSRIDAGEASCLALDQDISPEFLITDDLRALPELQTVATADVAISPIVLKALVRRDVLNREEARSKLDRLAHSRDWLGAPIYRRARRLFDE